MFDFSKAFFWCLQILLADFGIASQLTSVTCKKVSVVGTPYFMAPEVLYLV